MKEKKTIIILILVLTIGIVGLTIAYFSNSSTITNEFSTNPYGTTVTEEFVSPTNWLPGTTTDKTLVVTNSGSVDEAVRVSYSESWTSANSNIEGDLALSQNNNRAALINWTNPSDWTEVTEGGTTYRYYNYKLAPNEVTTSLLESVTFNPLITNSSNCTTTESNGTKTITCNSSGNGYDGATYKLVFTIETVQYNKYVEAWGTNVALLDEKPYPGTQYLLDNATNASDAAYTSETKGKMFTFTHTVNGNTVQESRYIGNAPNNYVKFNCDDDGTNCETWRILGVFSVDDGTGNVEQRMKLVRGSDFATNMAFNSSSNNDWTVSPLNTFLNGDYYNASGDAATYGLKATARSIIEEAKYYLGAVSWNLTNNNFGTTEKIYGEERGTTVCGACNSDTTKLTWTGIVGLMYPSDEYMVYGNGVNTRCYDNPSGCGGTNAQTGWVYNSNILEGQSSPTYTWLLSSYAGDSYYVLRAYNDGSLRNNHSFISIGVRPVVYLKSSIQIIDGDGSINNPYKLGL